METKYRCSFILTKEEEKACLELVEKMRAEEERKQKLQKAKDEISFAIAASIPEIGLEETRKVVNDLYRELKEVCDKMKGPQYDF